MNAESYDCKGCGEEFARLPGGSFLCPECRVRCHGCGADDATSTSYGHLCHECFEDERYLDECEGVEGGELPWAAAEDLRRAQRAYMAKRGDEVLGQRVQVAAEALDAALATDAGREVLERLGRYERALKSIAWANTKDEVTALELQGVALDALADPKPEGGT